MPAKRISKTEKILRLLDAVITDALVFNSYSELSKIVHGKKVLGEKVAHALANLNRYGYLEIVEKENQKAIRLTNKGKLKIWRPRIKKEWDGRWRIVCFDIEEERKGARDSFRNYLKRLGFRQMQKSLWICPYDISEQVEELIDLLHLETNIDYFIADAVTNKDKYLNMFNLNQ